jgi:hypothetical protein
MVKHWSPKPNLRVQVPLFLIMQKISLIFFMLLLQASQKIGAGLSASGLAGAGIGIGFIFGSLILGVSYYIG